MGDRIEQGNNNGYENMGLNLGMGNGRVLELDLNSHPLSLGRTIRRDGDPFPQSNPTLKFKASNFPMTYINIGSWEKYSMHESELVAKCYYGNKKLVWEVLEGGLKNKIEIHLGNIDAIKAIINQNVPGSLEILLSHPPQFFQEVNPQPRMHTIWNQSHDFTGGQASIFRRHYVQFPLGILDKHYKKLLQSDSHLLEISKKPFPELYFPYFPPDNFDTSNMSFGIYDFPRPQPAPTMSYPNSQMYHLQQGQADYNPPNSFHVQGTQSLNPDDATNMLQMNEDIQCMLNVQDGNVPLSGGVVNENDENFLNIEQLLSGNSLFAGSYNGSLLGNHSSHNRDFLPMPYTQSLNSGSYNGSLLGNQSSHNRDFFPLPYTQSINSAPYYQNTNVATNMVQVDGHMQFMPNLISSIHEGNVQPPEDDDENQ